MTVRSILLSLSTLLVPAAAQAANARVKFCFDLEVKFSDVSTGDHWTSFSSVNARYVKGKIVSQNGAVVWSGYAGYDGCTPTLSLSKNRQYTATLYSEALLSGNNQLVVYDDPTTPDLYQWSQTWRPSASGTKHLTWPLAASGSPYASNVFAVAGRTVDNLDAGVTDDFWVVYHDGCPGGGGSCIKSTNVDSAHPSWPTVYIHDSDGFGDRFKFVMAHEMGHLVGAMVDENRRIGGADSSASRSTTSALSSCANGSGHTMESEEWENSAASEGWAHFYAAATWNDPTDADCHFWEWNPTDGTIDCTEMEGWIVDECYGGDEPTRLTGNEGQYLAFWWHLYADEGYSFDELAAAWDEADPRSWTAASGGFDVYADLRSGAIASGIDAATWDYWAGVTGIDD